MMPGTHKLFCSCGGGCRVPIAEQDGNRLTFRKRVNGVWHVLVLTLPVDTMLDSKAGQVAH